MKVTGFQFFQYHVEKILNLNENRYTKLLKQNEPCIMMHGTL